MKIAIIGGGISGLYLAELLKDTHQITIFEGTEWGGDIKCDIVNGKSYPISTLFVMPHDEVLKNECDKRNLKRVDYTNNNLKVTLIFVSVVLINIGSIRFDSKIRLLILVLSIIMFILYIKDRICYYTLSFGAHPNCSKWMTSFKEFVDSTVSNYDFNSNLSYIPDCGMTKLYKSMLNHSSIDYIKKPVTNINRLSEKLLVTYDYNTTKEFDKCVIACPYSAYSKFMTLADKEDEVLSNVKYFDFYSTLVIFKTNVTETDLRRIGNYLGSFKMNDAYLIASQLPIVIPDDLKCNVLLYRMYKWEMPYIVPLEDKQNINYDSDSRNVYFVGKEISGNGINYCMTYVKRISELFK